MMPILAAIGAGGLSLLALSMAQVDGDTDIVPFFAGLTVAAVTQAVLVADPSVRWRRMAAFGVALLWLVAAVWIGGLLLMFKVMCSCSMPFPVAPERTYLGVTATAYHLVGLYGGLVLASLAAWSVSRRSRAPAR
ncbi:MAG: hypothetical protein ABI622_10525 [Chloroflexota bacterium]